MTNYLDLHSQKYNFEWLHDLSYLLFPKSCIYCGSQLLKQEETLCISCLEKLPCTKFHRLSQNPVFQKFVGRLPVKHGFSYLFFKRGNIAQTLLHQLKYNGREDIGERLGAMFAKSLIDDNCSIPDVIIPMPLHPSKQKLRGYNQCHSIARGMGNYLKTYIGYESVLRIKANTTQTRKARYERWLNVERIFEVNEPDKIIGRHVMLLDDVVTTGSTLESCGRRLLEAGARELSIATLASA